MTCYLIDDGTLDTVFRCEDCGQEVRYSSEVFERDETGALIDGPGAARLAEEDHADECDPRFYSENVADRGAF